MQTFPAHMPIQAGQTIGVDNSNNSDQIGVAAVPSNFGFIGWVPPLVDGTTEMESVSDNEEVAFNADVQPLPGITTVTPASGSIAGGTAVTITGHDFTGATSVTFNGANATSFTVNSDTQIAAVAPAASAAGTVDVRVTTAAGQTAVVPGDHFTYTACIVPKVTGKKLKTAKKKIKAAGCKVGKVKGHGPKVHKQSPKAAKVVAPGTKVSLKLGL